MLCPQSREFVLITANFLTPRLTLSGINVDWEVSLIWNPQCIKPNIAISSVQWARRHPSPSSQHTSSRSISRVMASPRRSKASSRSINSTLNVIRYEVFCQYQLQIHKDPASRWQVADFKRFLCSGLDRKTLRIDGKTLKLGSYHQCYRLDGKLVAVGVLDLLPHAVSSVYLLWVAYVCMKLYPSTDFLVMTLHTLTGILAKLALFVRLNLPSQRVMSIIIWVCCSTI